MYTIIIHTYIVVPYYDLEKTLREVYVVLYVSIVNNLRKFGRHNCATRRKMGIWLSTCLRKYTKRRFQRQLVELPIAGAPEVGSLRI